MQYLIIINICYADVKIHNLEVQRSINLIFVAVYELSVEECSK